MNTRGTLGLASLLLTTSLSTNADTLLGAYQGNQGWAMNEVTAMERWQDKKHAVINLYTNWTPSAQTRLFDHQLDNIWSHGSIPMITWEPTLAGETPDTIETQIANGKFDTFIQSWGKQLKHFLSGIDGIYGTEDDRRIYIRLAHEPNGTWYPWSATSGENTPDDYINMWRRTHDQFSALGLDDTRLQWVWAVNNVDIGDYTAEQYYPGDDYVDWVGMDGFNWGSDYDWSSWQSPPEIFEDMRQRLDTLAPEKPVVIAEVGSTSSNTHGIDNFGKNTWIEQFSQYIQDADIRMIAWFNEDKEADWQVFDGENGAEEVDGINTYPAYKTAVQSDQLIAADTHNLRILNDAQFQGNFDGAIGPASPAKSCEISYHITAKWKGGYVAKVSATANFLIPKNWNIDWSFAGNEQVSYGWNALIQQSNHTVSVTPPAWWKWMKAGSSPVFGFVGRGDGQRPITANLNGTDCVIING